MRCFFLLFSVVVEEPTPEDLCREETEETREEEAAQAVEASGAVKEEESRGKDDAGILLGSESKQKVIRRGEQRPREYHKAKKVPPKKVQKLHNLTGDLLFQVCVCVCTRASESCGFVC